MNNQTINVSKKVTDLMRKSYGFSHQKYSLTLKETDTKSQIWAKIARYVYRNACAENPDEPFKTSEMEDLDLFAGVLRKAYGKLHTLEKVDPSDMDQKEQEILGDACFKDGKDGMDRALDHLYMFTDLTKKEDERGRNILFLIDPENKISSRYTKRPSGYYYWSHPHPSYYVSHDGFMPLNMETVRGYALLFREAIKKANVQSKESECCGLNSKFYNDPMKYLHTKALHAENVIMMLSFSANYKSDFIKSGLRPYEIDREPTGFIEYTDKEDDDIKWAIFGDYMGVPNVQTSGEYSKCLEAFWAVQAAGFLTGFMANFVSQASMLKYQQQQSKQSHAKFYQTKKNIKQETQVEMTRLSNGWKDLFADVEIDNDVDLTDLHKIVPQITSIGDIIPRAKNGALPILRFRKLRNHKALGIFTPFNNTVAVDFRPSDGGGLGLQSFIHEYGHFLDYNTNEDNILSLSDSFARILKSAQSVIYKNKELSKKAEYYSTPTEVFARAFELYCSHCGLNNSLIKDPEVYDTSTPFTVFNDECRNWIYSYFNELFPDLEKGIKDKIEYEKFKDEMDSKPKYTGKAKSSYTDEELEQIMVHATKVSENAVQLALF